MQQSEAPLRHLVQSSRVVIVLGAGGVGKTTTSVALAVLGARLGKKVALLSIDPAKRLARAMGLSLGSRLSRVEFPAEAGIQGQLDAAMLDQKAVFDDMVRRFAPNARVAERIFNNSVYQQVATNLAGPLEYMAVAKLEELISDASYDLIVLDTPPDTHALDFLVRPNILAGFMENKVMTWLIKPFHFASKFGATKILTAGEKLMGGIAAVTGVKALQVLSEFLVLMEDVIKGFNRSGGRVTAALASGTSRFALVTSPRSSAIRSAMNIAGELRRYHYPLDLLVVNRYPPRDLGEAVKAAETSPADIGPFRQGIDALRRQNERAEELVADLEGAIEQLYGSKAPSVLIDEQLNMLHSTESLVELARLFETAPSRQ